MLYLNEHHFFLLGVDWGETVSVLETVVSENEFVQPIKPYLRYNDLKNRIIAMPSYVGGSIQMAGIKWIASFPDNINNGMPRAHSVVIANRHDTGEPICIINTPLLSIIRTASVSGMIIKKYRDNRVKSRITVGIIGFGPIGKYHVKMVNELLGNRLDKILVHDIRPVISYNNSKVQFVDSWQEAYDTDIFITCTTSDNRYIDIPPKRGQLILNVSLRDFKIMKEMVTSTDVMLVDDWEEVCRENTDIEQFHKQCGLNKKDIKNIFELDQIDFKDETKTIFFSPMGMGIFDIALTGYYYYLARSKKIGIVLD